MQTFGLNIFWMSNVMYTVLFEYIWGICALVTLVCGSSPIDIYVICEWIQFNYSEMSRRNDNAKMEKNNSILL